MLWNLYKFKELEDNYQVEVRRLPQGAPKELGRTQGSRCSERYVIHPSSSMSQPSTTSRTQRRIGENRQPFRGCSALYPKWVCAPAEGGLQALFARRKKAPTPSECSSVACIPLSRTADHPYQGVGLLQHRPDPHHRQGQDSSGKRPHRRPDPGIPPRHGHQQDHPTYRFATGTEETGTFVT